MARLGNRARKKLSGNGAACMGIDSYRSQSPTVWRVAGDTHDCDFPQRQCAQGILNSTGIPGSDQNGVEILMLVCLQQLDIAFIESWKRAEDNVDVHPDDGRCCGSETGA